MADSGPLVVVSDATDIEEEAPPSSSGGTAGLGGPSVVEILDDAQTPEAPPFPEAPSVASAPAETSRAPEEGEELTEEPPEKTPEYPIILSSEAPLDDTDARDGPSTSPPMDESPRLGGGAEATEAQESPTPLLAPVCEAPPSSAVSEALEKAPGHHEPSAGTLAPPPPLPSLSPLSANFQDFRPPDSVYDAPPARAPLWDEASEPAGAFDGPDADLVSIRDNDGNEDSFPADAEDYDRQALAADGGFPSSDDGSEVVTISDEPEAGKSLEDSTADSDTEAAEAAEATEATKATKATEATEIASLPAGSSPRTQDSAHVESSGGRARVVAAAALILLVLLGLFARKVLTPVEAPADPDEIVIRTNPLSDLPPTEPSQVAPPPEPERVEAGTLEPLPEEPSATPPEKPSVVDPVVPSQSPTSSGTSSSTPREEAPPRSASTTTRETPAAVSMGTFTIDSDPSEAEISIDDVRVGRTPLRGLALPAGQHKVSLRKEGYTPASRFIEVAQGEHLDVPVIKLPSLASLEPTTGLVNVYSVRMPQGGAKLWIDGNFIGNLPTTVSLGEGRHHFKVFGNDGSLFSVFREVRFTTPNRPVTLNLDEPDATPGAEEPR